MKEGQGLNYEEMVIGKKKEGHKPLEGHKGGLRWEVDAFFLPKASPIGIGGPIFRVIVPHVFINFSFQGAPSLKGNVALIRMY